jgi:pyruvate formate lyase activating enzyme
MTVIPGGASPNGIFITDIQRFSVNDGPGIRTTVFLKGCPLRCFWCHNPETQQTGPELMFFRQHCIGCESCAAVCPNQSLSYVSVGQTRVRRYDRDRCLLCGLCATNCPTDALKLVGRTLESDELVHLLRKDQLYFAESGGGVTFSGGEPLLQAEQLAGIAERVHAEGIHITIDTAGCVAYAAFARLLEWTDLFLYDIKSLSAERHRLATGQDNSQILANLERLAQAGKPIVIRVPIVPGFNDTRDELAAIARFAAELSVNRLDLLPLHRYATSKYAALGLTCAAAELNEPGPDLLRDLAEAARVFISDVRIERH